MEEKGIELDIAPNHQFGSNSDPCLHVIAK